MLELEKDFVDNRTKLILNYLNYSENIKKECFIFVRNRLELPIQN